MDQSRVVGIDDLFPELFPELPDETPQEAVEAQQGRATTDLVATSHKGTNDLTPLAAPLDPKHAPSPKRNIPSGIGARLSASLPERLAKTAFAYLRDRLTTYGNTLSHDHTVALRGLLWLATELALGRMSGRIRFGLPCGMGKTTGVRSFIRAIVELRLGIPIIVACSKVEQLCELKRQLITEDGVPPERIGLLHSYRYDPRRAENGHEGYASEPSEGAGRQFLLVTHANVKSGEYRRWMRDRDAASSLMFYDESLVTSEAFTLPLLNDSKNSLAWEAAGLKAAASADPALQEAADWCDAAVSTLLAAVRNHDNSIIQVLKVPEIDAAKAAEFLRLRIFETEQVPNLSALLKAASSGRELRVYTNSERNRALLSYSVTVPEELQRVIVLDASDAIRELVHHDHRMQRAEDVVPMLARFRSIPGGLASIKRYDRISVHVASEAGGRSTMRRAFAEGYSVPVVEKLIRLIKSKPAESFLIFTYKDRDGVHYERTLLKAMERAGININEQDEEGNFRISVLTWGMETATNAHKAKQNVVLLGVIFQPRESVAGAFLGQVDDLRSPELHRHLHSLVYAECTHSIYQAANRIAMRVVDVIDGQAQAKPCHVYIIHRDKDLRSRLDLVMPGATWQPWREEGEDMNSTEMAMLIASRLRELQAAGVTEVTLRQLKADVAPTVPRRKWQLARDEALRTAPWQIEGQRLVLSPFATAAA